MILIRPAPAPLLAATPPEASRDLTCLECDTECSGLRIAIRLLYCEIRFLLWPLAFSLFKMTPFVRLWLWISAFASLSGWTLSALGRLDRAGYLVCFAIFAIFL